MGLNRGECFQFFDRRQSLCLAVFFDKESVDSNILHNKSVHHTVFINAGPPSPIPFRVSVCLACTLNATGQSRVNASLR